MQLIKIVFPLTLGLAASNGLEKTGLYFFREIVTQGTL